MGGREPTGRWEEKIFGRPLWVPWMARRSNQSILKETHSEYLLNIHLNINIQHQMLKLKLQYLATWCKEPTHWKRLWCWKRLRAGGEGVDRGWDCWMAASTQWMWIWANSGRQWRTEEPGMLQFMGSQRVGQTEQLNDNKKTHKWLVNKCLPLQADYLKNEKFLWW